MYLLKCVQVYMYGDLSSVKSTNYTTTVYLYMSSRIACKYMYFIQIAVFPVIERRQNNQQKYK